jgi:predicted anti-sigma-YlaC factor YlaD
MECAKHQEQINQFIDGELEMRPKVELFQHLAVCVGCQSLLDVMMRMKEAVRNEHIPFPSELDDAILGQILSHTAALQMQQRVEMHRQRIWNRRVSIPGHLAASFAIIIIAVGLLLGRMFLPPAELSQQSTVLHTGNGQPQTVILIYGMPPVEVLGTPTVKTLKGIDQHNN